MDRYNTPENPCIPATIAIVAIPGGTTSKVSFERS